LRQRLRPQARPFTLLLVLAALLLSACAEQIGNTNWPGMSAVDDVVYIAGGNQIFAVDVVARRPLWTYPADGNLPAPVLAAPVVTADRIYLADYGASQGFLSPGVRASVYALSRDAAGIPVLTWQNEDVARDRIVAPPAAANGTVIVGTADNNVVALDSGSGTQRWSFPVGHSVWGQPVISGETIFLTSLDRSVYALTITGEQIWKQTIDGAIAARPLVADGTVYVSSFDSRVYAFDAVTGDERWRFAAGDWLWSAPALVDNTLYFGDAGGNVYAVDKDSGAMQWQATVNGSVEAGVVVADGMVYVPVVVGVTSDGQTGQFVTLAATDGSVVRTVDLAYPLYVTPVMVGDNVVILMQDTELGPIELRVYDRNGQQQWGFAPGAAQ
jgi:outer membrane protein assembly factor BamB